MDFRLISEAFPNRAPSEMTPVQEVFYHYVSLLTLLQTLGSTIPSFIYWLTVSI